jgi:hypothetical protein
VSCVSATVTASLCQSLYPTLVHRTNNYHPAGRGVLTSKLGIPALAGLWAVAVLSAFSAILWAFSIRAGHKHSSMKGKEHSQYKRSPAFGETPGIIRRATGKFLGYGISRYDDTSYDTLRVNRERSRSPGPSRGHSRNPSQERSSAAAGEQGSVEKPEDTGRQGRSEVRYEPFRPHEIP